MGVGRIGRPVQLSLQIEATVSFAQQLCDRPPPCPASPSQNHPAEPIQTTKLGADNKITL